MDAVRTVERQTAGTPTFSLALAGVLLVLVLLGLAFASLRSVERAGDLAEHSAQVRERLWESFQLLTDAETGQRGFLLTGAPSYLDPYDRARSAIPPAMHELRDLLRNPEQKARLEDLERLVSAKLSELGETVALQEAGQHAAALAVVEGGRGERTMELARTVQASMIRAEDAVLARRVARARLFERLSFVTIAFAGVALLVVGYLLQSVGRRLAQRELAEARAADLEGFAGRVAHDIRSPLESVSLAVEYARRHPGEPKTPTVLDGATRTLERVGALVEDLLLFARAGAPPAEGDRADVRSAVGDAVEEARPEARARGITLEVEGLCATTVACSPGVLSSITADLLENAVKYMGEAPVKRVTVGVTTDGATTRVEVRDTGPGIAPAYRDKLFDLHARVPGSVASGFALGLPTVRRLAEAHGGSVGFASNVPAGSVFWFTLPNASPTQESHAVRPPVVHRIRGLGHG
jgi:signal transduction histidine kinase